MLMPAMVRRLIFYCGGGASTFFCVGVHFQRDKDLRLKKINSDMRYTILLSLMIFVACNNNERKRTTAVVDTLKTIPETIQVPITTKPEALLLKTYSNKRFKDVTVQRIGQDTFLVRGEGQIFEANFSWSVEDGHYELKKGFQMTDAGAPEWGKFEFTINVDKKRENSTLTLFLFESSPKDGSRQYELPITLY
jgi:hypothetical protein